MRHLISLVTALLLWCVGATAQVVELNMPPAPLNKSLKVSRDLYELQTYWKSNVLSHEGSHQKLGMHTKGDSVQVVVWCVNESDPGQIRILEASGGRAESWHDRRVQMMVPIANLDWFETQVSVAAVYKPEYASTEELISEGITPLGIPAYHAIGFGGQGVKVAVIDQNFQYYQLDLGTELPTGTEVVQFGDGFYFNDGPHGTQCAEIIHDAAPGAEMWLIQIDSEMDLLAALDWVRASDFDVVSISLGFRSAGWADGNSPLSKKVETLSNEGTLVVVAAGNEAQQHWVGSFADADQDGWMDFAAGDETMRFWLDAGTVVVIETVWDDWPVSNNDYNLYLYDQLMTTVLDLSVNAQSGTQPPSEAIVYEAPYSGYYNLSIWNYNTIGSRRIRIFLRNASVIQHVSPEYSLTIPGDSKGALTVGAVPVESPNSIEPFSSNGPTEDQRVKPDLVGPDHVSVWDGFFIVRPYGTSFACPHIAGAAAVYLSVNPGLAPTGVKSALMNMCNDLGSAGLDNVYGAGFLHLDTPVVNSPPELPVLPDQSVAENQVLTFDFTASDQDGDILTYSYENHPTGSVVMTIGNSRIFSWTPTYDQAGVYENVIFSVSDAQATDSDTITITVLNINRPPTMTAVQDQVGSEGELLSFNVNASDPDNDPLTYSAVNLPQGAAFGPTEPLFAWIPSFDQAGIHGNIILSVSDGEASDSDTIEIEIINTNRAPTISAGDNRSVPEGEDLSFIVTSADPDGDDLTLSASNLPAGASFDIETGAFAWTPTFDQAGTYDNILFQVSDGEATAEDFITIEVTNTNRPPDDFVLLEPADSDTLEETTVELSWQRATDPDGDDVTYEVFLSESDTLNWLEVAAELSDSALTLSDLNEGSWYYWRAVAGDEGGLSKFSVPASFHVPDLTPPEFSFFLQPNTVLPFALDVIIQSSEQISENVVLSYTGAANGSENALALSGRSNYLYLADLTVEQTGTLNLSACGTDMASNIGCEETNVTVGKLVPGQPTAIASPSSEIGINVYSVLGRGVLVLDYLREYQATGKAVDNDGFSQNALCSFKIDFTERSIEEFDIAIKPEMLSLDPASLALVKAGASQTPPIPLWLSERTGDYIATLSEKGTYHVIEDSRDNRSGVSRVLPTVPTLQQNSPNPFNAATKIPFYVPATQPISIEIRNILGQTVSTIASGRFQVGEHFVSWNATDDSGSPVASGVYFAVLRSEGAVDVRRIVLLK